MPACGRFLPLVTVAVVSVTMAVEAQMIDNNQAPNVAKAGINKSLQDEIGAGRGNVTTPGSSMCMIAITITAIIGTIIEVDTSSSSPQTGEVTWQTSS